MRNITATFTEEELTVLGRAMERSGHTSLEDYFRYAILQQSKEIVDTPQKQD